MLNKIKSLLEYEKEIIEGMFVSIIGGWAISSIVRGAASKISDLQFVAQSKLATTIVLLLVFSIALGIIYYKKDNVARLLMFAVVYCFLFLSAVTSYSIQWKESYNNSIGNACFLAVLCFVAVLAFLYVKDDVFQLFKSLKINRLKAKIIFAALGIFMFTFVAIIAVYRYITYSNSTFDFGIFAQMYEYMRQTGAINTTVERNVLLSHFGVHFSPIYYIALPLYFIFPSPITVQLIQCIMIVLPIIPIVLLCRQYKMSNWMIVAMILLYALYPATIGGTLYDIHENCFLIFFMLLGIYAIERKRDILAIVSILLAFMVKEDAAVYVLIIGAYFLFSRRDKKRGIVLMLASVVYFAIAVIVVNSYGLGIQEYRFGNFYYNQNGSLIQVFITIITNPGYAISQMVANTDADSMDKISYIILMIVPVAAGVFTTGKKYSRYIFIAPFIIINVMTTYLYMHDINFQYDFGVIALFMYVIIMNLADKDCYKAKTLVCVSVICASIMFAGTVYPKAGYYIDKYLAGKTNYQKLDLAMQMIPDGASVCASGFFVPHLSDHLELYDQSHLTEDIYTDYLVVDERGTENEKFENILATGKYQLIYAEQDLVSVYKINE